jgi:hypothetical protein
LTVNDLANLLFASSAKDKDYYQGVLENLETFDVGEDSTITLINSILSHKKLKEISLAAYDVTEGKLEHDKMRELLTEYLKEQEAHEKEEQFDFISDDLEELVNDAVRKPGLRWRVKTLNRCLALSGKAISDLYSLGLKQEKPPSWLVKLPLWRSSLQKMQDQLYGSITKSKETK